jgi:hypothetical protein
LDPTVKQKGRSSRKRGESNGSAGNNSGPPPDIGVLMLVKEFPAFA